MNKHLPISNTVRLLEDEIETLKIELNLIDQKVSSFEATLRSHLMDLMIEERELYSLYKTLKKEKREKRIAQKQKGKNYKAPTGLIVSKQNQPKLNKEEEKEKKRLYRETMLLVHPDKFSMDGDDNEAATEMTSKLIDIYKYQDLENLKAFHAYVQSGCAPLSSKTLKNKNPIAKELYLEKEKEQLLAQLIAIKSRYVYKVLREYANPLRFVDELNVYYTDRIAKLKKRTRKAHS